MSIATLLETSSTTTSESKQAPWVAVIDALSKSAINEVSYTDAEKAKGARMYSFIKDAFPTKTTYLNYREKFIAIKVANVRIEEAQKTHTQLLEDLCELSNVKIVTRGKNVIFRVMK